MPVGEVICYILSCFPVLLSFIDCKISKGKDLILIILSFQCFTHRKCSKKKKKKSHKRQRRKWIKKRREGRKKIICGLSDRAKRTLDLEPKNNIFKQYVLILSYYLQCFIILCFGFLIYTMTVIDSISKILVQNKVYVIW